MRLVGRRLPDILIGILIVVLALGLGSLLLTQRNRAATTPSALTPPAVSSTPGSTASIPAAPGTAQTQTQTQTPAQPQAAAPPAAQVPSAPNSAAQPAQIPAAQTGTAQTGSAQTSSAPSTTAQTGTVPAQPESPSTPSTAAQPPGSAGTTTSPGAAATGPVPTSSVAAPVTPQPDTSQPPVTTGPVTTTPDASLPNSPAFDESGATTPATSTPAPRSGGPVATSENRTPLRRDYRISLGTFGSEAEANASTAAVRALGYTVYPIDLGSQVVAQVGPFADAVTANAALSDISRTYGGAALYAPRQSATGNPPSSSQSLEKPAASSAASGSASTTAPTPATPAASSTTSPAASTAAPTPPDQAAAPSGPVYLQVGAFDRQDSAQRMVGLLGDLGYSPSVQAPEGKKVTVLIGPFSGDAVLRAESKLSDNGFDHFRVR